MLRAVEKITGKTAAVRSLNSNLKTIQIDEHNVIVTAGEQMMESEVTFSHGTLLKKVFADHLKLTFVGSVQILDNFYRSNQEQFSMGMDGERRSNRRVFIIIIIIIIIYFFDSFSHQR